MSIFLLFLLVFFYFIFYSFIFLSFFVVFEVNKQNTLQKTISKSVTIKFYFCFEYTNSILEVYFQISWFQWWKKYTRKILFSWKSITQRQQASHALKNRE